VSKNIYLKNNIALKFSNERAEAKNKIKIEKIISNIFNSLDSKRDAFHSLSKKFKFNFKPSQLIKFNKYKSIILIGMGGSSLGAEALYNFFRNKIEKELFFFNNLDQSQIEKTKTSLKNSLFIIISKSGNTLETLINTNLLKDKINKKNTIIITEKKTNLLNQFAKDKKILEKIY